MLPGIRRLLSVVLYFAAAFGSAQAAVDWPQLKFSQAASGLTEPTAIANAGDGTGRLFLVEQPGTIRILQNSAVLSTPFLDIHARVLSTYAEQGLLGIAFPPNYATKKHFYVNYTRQTDGATVISRFSLTANGNVADAASEQVLLIIPQPYNNHNGGQLAFGSDGFLYIGMGDGGSSGDPQNYAQNPASLLGKILRIDVESGGSGYTVPANNPFVGNAAYKPEIWSLGLRNPWRSSFDRANGDLYIGDVGEYSWEEIDYEAAHGPGGANYGWRIREGNHDFIVPNGFDVSTLTPPVAEYSHSEGFAVTGGYVYRGPATPRMPGIYFYADFEVGRIWGLERDAGVWVSQAVSDTSFKISCFGEDETGRLYLADYVTGTIYLIDEDTVVGTPTFTPAAGTYHTEQSVVISTKTSGATIHFTVNGADPTESDPVPNGPIAVTTNTVLRARAYKPGLTTSAVAVASYTLQPVTPTFSPNGGALAPNSTIYIIGGTDGATIHYTIDGTTPTAASPVTSGGAVTLATGDVTVQAILTKPGWTDSAVGSIYYPRATVGVPTFAPASGAIYGPGGHLSMSSTTFVAAIHYTLDGSTPTASSPLYTGALTPDGPISVKAIGIAAGYNDSPVANASFYLLNGESGAATNWVGSTTAGFADGQWGSALFRSPEGICVDSADNLYVADTGNHAIRKVTPDGFVTTIAGTGTAGYLDAAGTAARFSSPRGVCVDSTGSLYVTDDGNNRLRKIDTAGNVTTIAGSGVNGDKDGAAASAQFDKLQQIEIAPTGDLLFGSARKVRKLSQGTVSTVATVGSTTGSRIGLAVDKSNNIYASDESAKVYKISSGTANVYSGSSSGFSDGSVTTALYSVVRDIAVDALGNIDFCDQNRIRKVHTDGSVITAEDYYGPGVASLSNPRGLCVDGTGYIFIADTGNNRIRRSYPSDWDQDGIPDSFEGAGTGFVIGVDDRTVDSDGDGFSNTAEYKAGTDPLDPKSRLAVQDLSRDSLGRASVSWKSVSGKSYQVQYSDDLAGWNVLLDNIAGTGATLSTMDANATGKSRRFYRVIIRGT